MSEIPTCVFCRRAVAGDVLWAEDGEGPFCSIDCSNGVRRAKTVLAPPTVGEDVFFVLALGDRAGERRPAKIVREHVFSRGVEWASLAVFTTTADGAAYSAPVVRVDAPYDASGALATWHRALGAR